MQREKKAEERVAGKRVVSESSGLLIHWKFK